MTTPLTIRPGKDSDAEQMIALIDVCWSQYPGVLMDVDGEMPELRALASYYAGKGGALWVAEAEGTVIGMIATRPHEAESWEICRVYVSPNHHGGGLGHRLLDAAEAHAGAAGAERLVLWSDTRFDRAHRFYEKRGYLRSGPIRVLDDISHSLEFAYAKPLHGVERLDPAAAASAVPGLAALLADCVADDAQLAFLPPLSPETARAHWQDVARGVATGQRMLLVAWTNGRLSGAVSAGLPAAPTQRHRCELEDVLLQRDEAPGRALLQRVEQESRDAGRSLLVVDTAAGSRAEPLLRSLDWREAGRVPGYAQTAEGAAVDALRFWKRLD